MQHIDVLQALHDQISLTEKLQMIHQNVRHLLPFIDRISFAIYDEKTDLLRTFIISEQQQVSLALYETKLSDVPSLLEVAAKQKPRVLEDISGLYNENREHSKRIKECGYQASYTLPMFTAHKLSGFIFFNSRQKNPFRQEHLDLLDVFAHLIFSLVLTEINQTVMLLSTMRTISKIMRFKDPETGSHLERMAHFSRIIANHLAQSGKYPIDDEFIQFLFAFAPLHDIGKIGIPDNILLKPKKLDPHEFQIMKEHTVKGRQIIDLIVENLPANSAAHIEMMRNIPELHHEKLDGAGYPHGYADGQIPLEAQIIAVADVFDALTSERPYKRSWSNEQALEYLKKNTSQLNKDMVAALEQNLAEVIEIQNRFKDEQLTEESR